MFFMQQDDIILLKREPNKDLIAVKLKFPLAIIKKEKTYGKGI